MNLQSHLSGLWCLNVKEMQVGETRVTVAVVCFILLERVAFKEHLRGMRVWNTSEYSRV